MQETTKVASYDPQKSYKWDQNTEIKISGMDFGILQNFVTTYVQNGSQLPLHGMNAENTIGQILQQNVENGNFTEVKSEDGQ